MIVLVLVLYVCLFVLSCVTQCLCCLLLSLCILVSVVVFLCLSCLLVSCMSLCIIVSVVVFLCLVCLLAVCLFVLSCVTHDCACACIVCLLVCAVMCDSCLCLCLYCRSACMCTSPHEVQTSNSNTTSMIAQLQNLYVGLCQKKHKAKDRLHTTQMCAQLFTQLSFLKCAVSMQAALKRPSNLCHMSLWLV